MWAVEYMRAAERWLWCVNKALNPRGKPYFHVGGHSGREAEEGDVAVLEDVFFAFQPVFAGFTCGSGAAEA